MKKAIAIVGLVLFALFLYGCSSKKEYIDGNYVLDGEIATGTEAYCDQIVFFSDGRCHVHYVWYGTNKANVTEYSYSSKTDLLAIGGINFSFFEDKIPSVSEDKQYIYFENYTLKRQ